MTSRLFLESVLQTAKKGYEEIIGTCTDYLDSHQDDLQSFALDCIPVVGTVKQGRELYILWDDASFSQRFFKGTSFAFSVGMDVAMLRMVTPALKSAGVVGSKIAKEVVKGGVSSTARNLLKVGAKKGVQQIGKEMLKVATKMVQEKAVMRATYMLGGKIIGIVCFTYANNRVEIKISGTEEEMNRLREEVELLKNVVCQKNVQISQLKEEVAGLKEINSELQKVNSEQKTRIILLKQENEELEKKFLLLEKIQQLKGQLHD